MSLISRMVEWISGRYIKTVSNQTIFGEGNIAGGGGFEPTTEQLTAMNSGIDSTKVAQIATNTNDIADKVDKLTDEGEFIYAHDGETQNSKAFIAGITGNELLNSAAHVPAAKAVKQFVDRNGHLLYYANSRILGNDAVFDFSDCNLIEDTGRVVEIRVFQGTITDPISNSNINGSILTKQYMVRSGGAFTVYIEQEFTQYSSAAANQVIKLRRKGNVALDSLEQYTNWVASKSASISWNLWIPVEYPSYVIDNIQKSGKGQLSYIKCCVCGGILIMRAIWSASSTGESGTVYTFPVKVKIEGSGATTIYYPISNSNGGFCEAILKNDNTLLFNAFATGDYRVAVSIPLGY